jgi:hypothetical protein
MLLSPWDCKIAGERSLTCDGLLTSDCIEGRTQIQHLHGEVTIAVVLKNIKAQGLQEPSAKFNELGSYPWTDRREAVALAEFLCERYSQPNAVT